MCWAHFSSGVTHFAPAPGSLQSPKDVVFRTRKLSPQHITHCIFCWEKHHAMEVCRGWCRNVPVLALLLLGIRAASSSQARMRPLAQAVLTSSWVFFSGWVSSPPTEPGSNKQRPCVLLWFCISLSHSSQWADVRRLFIFWSIAICRLGRKHCVIPDNCPNTSKCYILLSLDLLLNLEVIPDLPLYWIFVFMMKPRFISSIGRGRSLSYY